MSDHYRSNLASLPLGYEMSYPEVPRQYSNGADPGSPSTWYKTSIINPIDYVRAVRNKMNYTTGSTNTAEDDQSGQVYQCPECDTQCTGPHAKGNMSRHMRKHIQQSAEETSRTLTCPYCEAEFQRSDAKLKHVRRTHPEVNIDIDDPASKVPSALPQRQYAEVKKINNLLLQHIDNVQMRNFLSNLADVLRYTENDRPGDQSTLGLRRAIDILKQSQNPDFLPDGFCMLIDGESTDTVTIAQQALGTSYYLSFHGNGEPSNSTNQAPYENMEYTGLQPLPLPTDAFPPAGPGQMLFGCHVCKYHKLQGYPPTCNFEGATGLSSVIDHLRQKCHRSHIRPISRCKICWGFFFDDTGACGNDHSCLMQGERLVQPRGARQENAWVTLFLMFYPNTPAIPSPYVGDDRLVDSTCLPVSPSGKVSFLPLFTPQDGIYGELPSDDSNAPSMQSQSTSRFSENAIQLATTSSLGAIAQVLQDCLRDGANLNLDYAQRLIYDNRGRLSETDRHYLSKDIRTLTLELMGRIHTLLDEPEYTINL